MGLRRGSAAYRGLAGGGHIGSLQWRWTSLVAGRGLSYRLQSVEAKKVRNGGVE